MSRVSTIVTAVATAMGNANAYGAIGTQAEARRFEPPRITWVPTRERAERPRQQHSPSKTVCHERQARLDVYIVGRTFDEAESLWHSFLARLDETMGGSVVYDVNEAQWSAEAVTTNGRFELVVPVVLKFPVFREELSTVDLLSGTLTAKLTDAMGQNPHTS